MDALIREAVAAYLGEFESLRFLPESRYDRERFPTVGQYDWVAGQVLYALIRLCRPRRIIEFSTSSGYSTAFMALALERNGTGHLYSVDLDAAAQRSAGRVLQELGVAKRVTLLTGDCRAAVPSLLSNDLDLVFIDTLHSFDIAEWYFREVIPRLRPGTLVHIHDVMPPEARVRIHGGPPYAPRPDAPRPGVVFLLKRMIWLLLHGRFESPFPARPPRELLPFESLTVYPAEGPRELPTIDGNYFEEAVLIRELMRGVPAEDAVFLHRVDQELGISEPQRYASRDQIQRSDRFGQPREWNDALWAFAATLQKTAPPRKVRDLIPELRREYRRAASRNAP